VETTDWRAVCGKTARTVRREGRTVSFPTPINLVIDIKVYLGFHEGTEKSALAGRRRIR
jgi:hypothetical protein